MKDFVELIGHRETGLGVDGSHGNTTQLAGRVEFDDSVAGVLGAAINSEDAHESSLAPAERVLR